MRIEIETKFDIGDIVKHPRSSTNIQYKIECIETRIFYTVRRIVPEWEIRMGTNFFIENELKR
jgi:hypothetical protein